MDLSIKRYSLLDLTGVGTVRTTCCFTVLAKVLFIWCIQERTPEIAMVFWKQRQVRTL